MDTEFSITTFECDFGVISETGQKVIWYEGPYEVTPEENDVTLETSKLTMKEKVLIRKIPSNYGKITWTGATLKVE